MVIPVLMYHSIDNASSDYLTVAADDFRRHVAFLAGHQSLIRMREAIQALEGQLQIPEDAVVISFDDSFQDNIRYAAPILEEFKAKAIFFTVAGCIGKDNAWDHKAYKISRHMTASELRDLVHKGHDIGNHSLTHQRLTKLEDTALEDEFSRSNAILEELTGIRPEAFAYPYGGVDERVAAYCRRHFKAGFATVRDGVFDWTEDPSMIRRIYVSPADRPEDLMQKITCYRRGIQHA